MHIYAWRARRPSSYRDRRTSVSQINHSNVALQVRSISDDDSRQPSIKIICPRSRLLLTFFFLSFLSFFSVPYPSFLLISLSYHKITRYLVMRETKDSIDFFLEGVKRGIIKLEIWNNNIDNFVIIFIFEIIGIQNSTNRTIFNKIFEIFLIKIPSPNTFQIILNPTKTRQFPPQFPAEKN